MGPFNSFTTQLYIFIKLVDQCLNFMTIPTRCIISVGLHIYLGIKSLNY